MLRGFFVASVVAAMLASSATAGADETAARYVAASVAMQCAARSPEASKPAQREARNDKLLREHGFTRASFAQAGFTHAGRAPLEAEIRRGVSQCGKADAPKGRYAGAFKSASVTGRADLNFTSGGVRGSVVVKYQGRSIGIPIRNHNFKAGRVQTGGSANRASYALVMNLSASGDELEALLVIDGGKGPERHQFTIPRK